MTYGLGGLVLAVAVFAPVVGAAGPTNSCRVPSLVVNALRQDLKHPDVKHAWDAEEKLMYFMANAPRRCRVRILPWIIDMLGSDSDDMRNDAASTLIDIGPPARSTLPALKQALKLDKCVCSGSVCAKREVSSTWVIRAAIYVITGSFGDPVLYSCEYTGAAHGQPDGPGRTDP